MNNITQLLAHDNFLVVNKYLISKIGLDETVILSELASEHNYWAKQNKLDEDGYFFSTIENVSTSTGYKISRQRKIVNRLKELNLIDFKIKGLPGKRYFKLNQEEILRVINSVQI